VKWKVAPRPEFSDAQSRPPCDSIIVLLIDNPIPVPPTFVVKKALKISYILSAGIPTPVSLTDAMTSPLSHRVLILSSPPCSLIASMPFSIKFINTFSKYAERCRRALSRDMRLDRDA